MTSPTHRFRAKSRLAKTWCCDQSVRERASVSANHVLADNPRTHITPARARAQQNLKLRTVSNPAVATSILAGTPRREHRGEVGAIHDPIVIDVAHP
jgi:hypothetical protein